MMQLLTGMNWGKNECYPVITLVLYLGDKPWGRNSSIYDAVQVPEELRPYVSDYRINFFEIAHLTDEEIECFHSDFRIVADYFTHRRTDPDYRPKDPIRFRHAEELMNLMAAVTGDSQYLEGLDTEGGRPDNMDEYLNRLINKGRMEGLAAGRVEGLSQGRVEGEITGRMKTLTKLVRDGLLTAATAAREMNITTEEFQKKAAELAAEK